MNYIAINPDNFYNNSFGISIAHRDGEVSLWDIRKMNSPSKFIESHDEDCRCVEFDPSGKFLTTASFDSLVKIYDLYEDRFVQVIGKLLK